MMGNPKLHHYIEATLLSNGEKSYLRTATQSLSFKRVYEMALAFQGVLENVGVEKNERVVIYSSKNAESIALMIACSKSDCIYVPVSSTNPAQRAKYIVEETGARFILCDGRAESELQKAGASGKLVHEGETVNLYAITTTKKETPSSESAAFILFTSGSTGTPKGVVISHAAAITFIDWAANEFSITENDILASIAPFNFDLSVFDIYVSAKKAATLVLYAETETWNALLMAQQLSQDSVTTIYATPTFYTALAYYGKLQKFKYPALKNVLFAGEVFHLENFNALLKHWPDKLYANLYGPTETNVCTFFKVVTNQIDYSVFPIGKKCQYANLLLLDADDNEITKRNTKGELLVAGGSLFTEYWNDPDKTANSIFTDNNNTRFYRTGDLVYYNNEDNLIYVARKDRMIKKNGFRIEPSEIEMVLTRFPNVSNAAALFNAHKNQLVCFIECPEPMEDNFDKLKLFCQNYLPGYMIPDKFVILEAMPKTSSGKVDLQALDKQL